MDPNTQWILDNRKLKYILGLSVAFPHALQGDQAWPVQGTHRV